MKYLKFVIIITILFISSISFAKEVHLSWLANTEEDLNGYNVYYGTSSRNYNPCIPVGNITNYVINLDPSVNTFYYFAVTALDNSGNESGYSQEIKVLLKPIVNKGKSKK